MRLLEADFLDGGIFSKINVSKHLPIPEEIISHIYGEKCVDLDISSELNLLIFIWKLKGLKMYRCACQTNNHLVTEEEHKNQIQNIHKITREDFQPNGLFYDTHLLPKLPLNSDLLHYMFRDLCSYNGIQDGFCFKSNWYQINLLKEWYRYKNEVPAYICNKCCTHLNF